VDKANLAKLVCCDVSVCERMAGSSGGEVSRVIGNIILTVSSLTSLVPITENFVITTSMAHSNPASAWGPGLLELFPACETGDEETRSGCDLMDRGNE